MLINENTKKFLKFILMGLVLFSLSIIYIVLRDIKSVLIVTSSAGPSLIPPLNMYSIVVKGAVVDLFFLFYRRRNLPKICFVSTILIFLLLIGFHFWGLEGAQRLHPNPALLEELLQNDTFIPQLFVAYSVWTFSLYYLLADIWGAFIIGFLFWAFANQAFTFKEAKLSYPLLTLFPAFGALLSEYFLQITGEAGYYNNLPLTLTTTGYLMLGGITLFMIGGIFIHKLKFDKVRTLAEEMPKIKKMTSSFKWKYFFFLFIVIAGFEINNQLAIVLFKSHISAAFIVFDDYYEYMSSYSTYKGYFSAISFLVTFWMIWRFGWTKSALIPPILAALTTGGFLFYLHTEGGGESPHSLSMTTYEELLFFLSLQTFIFAGLKTLFFATKEMAFIPLAITTKVRGKAFIDYFLLGVISTSLVTLLLFLFDSIHIEYDLINVMYLMFGTSFIWGFSVLCLGRMVKSLTKYI